MRSFVLALSIGLAVLHASSADAQSTRTKKAPQFQPPTTINKSLPNVLIIGDSISIGYMLPARKALAGEANVFRPATNCGPSTKGLAEIEKWLGDRKWDVIHWNHGLHDLKYMGPNGENLADPEAETSKPQVPLDAYKANLTKLAKRLKATGATVIWCDTTPVPEGAKGRVVGDSKRYNEAAHEVMKAVGGIEINPLYDFAMKNVETRPANVHYTPEGSAKLAEQVANSIRPHLK